jgi:uncharacterized membrane protein YkvA (DUF1232 family)
MCIARYAILCGMAEQTSLMQRLQAKARALKTEVYALYLAYRDPRTPWVGKAVAAMVVAYAFSPIDLIPDPIPILGYLDDLILVPLGVIIALRLIPADVMVDSRLKAAEVMASGKPVSWVGAVIIGAVWLTLAAIAIWLTIRFFQHR